MEAKAEPNANNPDRRRIMSVILAAVVSITPLFFFHCLGLWSKPEYQYFPFVIAAFGWLAFHEWQSSEPESGRGRVSIWFHVLSCLSIFELFYAWRIQSNWTHIPAIVLVIGATIAWLETYRRMPNIWWIWTLLWLLVPFPYGLDESIIRRLQLMSSRISSEILDLLRIDHLLEGVVLSIPGQQLFVDEACSGIVSVRSIVAVALILSVWKRRPAIHTAALLICAVLWAMCTNVVRILTIVLGFEYFDVDLAHGAAHDVLGLGVFMLCFLCVLSTDAFLAFFFGPIVNPRIDEPIRGFVPAWNWLCNFGLAAEIPDSEPSPANEQHNSKSGRPSNILYVYSGLTVLLCLTLTWRQVTAASFMVDSSVLELVKQSGDDFFPESIGAWTKVAGSFEHTQRERDNIEGEFSNLINYQDSSGQLVTVSIDYPFDHWHELTICYSRSGWTPVSRSVQPFSIAENERGHFVDVVYEGKGHGRSMFALMDKEAVLLQPPQQGPVKNAFEGISRSLRENLRRFVGLESAKQSRTHSRPVIQMQVWRIGPEPDAEDDHRMQQLLDEVIGLVTARLGTS